jgi:hypothetical protein
MIRRILKFILSMMIVLSFNFSFAQDESTEVSSDTRSNIAKIIYAGLGGAVLGLSTLSFYGRPQDHLSNVMLGFSAGIIGGAVYVTFKSVQYNRSEEPTLVFEDNRNQNLSVLSQPQWMIGYNF